MGSRGGLTLAQIAAALGGKVDGDPDRVVTGVAALDDAGPDDISFVTDPRYRRAAARSGAGALVVPDDLPGLSVPLVRCRSPRQALVDLLLLFHPPAAVEPGIAPAAVVAPDARVDTTASIGALSVIEAGAVIGPRVVVHPLVYVGAGASIGEDSVLHPHVAIGRQVTVGCRVTVHSGAVLGADGFGYAFDGTRHRKIPQVGRVVVEDDVEIGANTTIDRATLGETVVRRGSKIDNLVMIAHNVEIGDGTLIAAQTGIAGSSRVGRRVVIGGQAGIADHVTVGDGAMLGAQTGIASDVAPGEKLIGRYGRPVTQAQRILVAETRLPELLRRVRVLERRLARLEGADAGSADEDDGGR